MALCLVWSLSWIVRNVSTSTHTEQALANRTPNIDNGYLGVALGERD